MWVKFCDSLAAILYFTDLNSLNMESFPDVQILKAQARQQFTLLLGNFYGKKDLVIDPSLMTLLDRITGLQFLKEKGVDKVYKLEHKEILGGGNKRAYIVRPSVRAMRQIAAHIHSDKRAGKWCEICSL